MKKLQLIVICALLLCLAPNVAFADVQDELDKNVQEGLNNIDFSQMDGVGGYFGSVAQKVQQIIGGQYVGLDKFWQVALELFGQTLKDVMPQLLSLLAILIILGLIRSTSDGIVSQNTSDVVSFVGVSVVLFIVLALVVDAFKQVTLAIGQISALSQASMPILLTLVVANGGSTLSTVCQPSMVMFSGGIIEIVKNIVLPLCVVGLVFKCVNSLTDNLRVQKLGNFFTNGSSWVLGVVFMLFSAFTTVQSISAATMDGVTFRAVRFSVKSYVPILGGYLADGFDMVMASTTLIKNAFGLCTLGLLLYATLQPLFAIVCLNVGLQAVGAVCEPITHQKYLSLLSGIGKTLTFLAVLVVAVAFMFCILVLVAICCVNGV